MKLLIFATALFFAVPVFAQPSHISGGLSLSGSRGLGYDGPSVGPTASAAYRHARFVFLTDASFLRAPKQGSHVAFSLDGEARGYVNKSIFLSVGVSRASQFYESVTATATRVRVGGGINYRDQVIGSVAYSFPDQTKYRARSIDFSLSYFHRLRREGKVFIKPTIDLRLARFDVGNEPASGHRAGIRFEVGRYF